jgi:hypothetical protein
LAKNEDLTCKKLLFFIIENSGAGFYCIFFAEIGQQSDVLLLAFMVKKRGINGTTNGW